MIWAIAAILFGAVLARRPALVVFLAIGAYILIPGVARGVLTPFLHPGAYLVAGYAVAAAIIDRQWFSKAIQRSRGILAVAAVIVAYASIDALNEGTSGLPRLLQSLASFFLMPLTVFVIGRHVVAQTPKWARIYAAWLLVIGVVEIVLAYFQNLTGLTIVWGFVYRSMWFWGQGDDVSRALGTTGHGIQLSVFLAMTICVTPMIRSTLVRFGYIGLAWIALPWTNGRLGMLLAGLATAYVFFYSRRTPLRTVLMSLIVLVGIGWSLQTEEGQKVIRKFSSDGGSNQKRIDALAWGRAHWREFLFSGYPGNRDVRGSGLLSSSLENGYLMAGMAFGLVVAAALFLLQVVTIARCVVGSPRARVWGLTSALGVIAFFGSSSFMADSLDGVTTWIFMGIGLGLADAARGPAGHSLRAHASDERHSSTPARQDESSDGIGSRNVQGVGVEEPHREVVSSALARPASLR
ncbi:hypothetical protein [Falsarthrobacter nasiphocae]|uniref:O-antigen ligase domain-containing protein n=1 Tax=Falsarthrobacter nasiphocae TaxID=189863 RepID=A0AAE4C5K1_9MICC|nr:hypothetical protein [Falsarthrobacter nasiphocae]MDR6891593.1 hypothetical protein [Falsarthrobacter nasiphocae]